jgi:DNA repair and recombination protein RAD54B
MRLHQKKGVEVSARVSVGCVNAEDQFMYSCVMGLTEAKAEGCILADEMGLGKTLQTIALIQMLLSEYMAACQGLQTADLSEQSPYSHQERV